MKNTDQKKERMESGNFEWTAKLDFRLVILLACVMPFTKLMGFNHLSGLWYVRNSAFAVLNECLEVKIFNAKSD